MFAAVLTVAVFLAGDVIAGSYPFGARTRSVNDLGNQFVPFHAHLWDLLHGRADGGLLFNWQSGLGASFLPDLGTYVSSPFALLVAVFPRDEIDLAVYVITVLKVATAGAAMACLLLVLRTGRWWAAGLLGASYALCGWTLASGAYNPMWLDGLIALPVLCLVGEWLLQGRRLVLGTLIVALAWVANFYTAYMATLGAGLILLLRLWLGDFSRRQRLRAAGRAAVRVVLGVGLSAPLVSVVYFGTQHAYPGRKRHFVPPPTEDLLARLLPTTYKFTTPAVFVGTTALLLALALPFHRAVPGRVRTGWTLLVVAVALSMLWHPTHLLWHAFATPQGSAYRQAFVLCGLLVIAAWHALSYGPPDLRALGAAGALLALIIAFGNRSEVRDFTLPLALLGAAGALGGLLLLTWQGGRYGAAVAAVLLVCTQVGEATATAAVDTRMRFGRMDDYAPWGERQQEQAEAISKADGWPRYRTDPGREQTVANDPLMVGGQGAQYYSSLTSDVLTRMLTSLGGGWTSRGRNVHSLDNAVTDAIFSVGARVHSPPDPHQTWFAQDGSRTHVTRQDVPPLVTVRPRDDHAPAPTGVAAFGPSPYPNQELLLGAHVYTLPRLTVRTLTGHPPSPSDDDRPGLRLGRLPYPTEGRPTITGSCPAGDELYLWAPHFSGTARFADAPADGLTGRFRADYRPLTKISSMQHLGTVPASGRFRIDLSPNKTSFIPYRAVGCLDTARLRTAVARLKDTGATRVSVADGTVRAELPAGSTGIAVVATPAIAGWRCAAGDAPAVSAQDYYGLLAVPLDGTATSVTCTFRPPGLLLGAAAGGASLATLIVFGVIGAIRRRRAGRPPGARDHHPTPPEPLTTGLAPRT